VIEHEASVVIASLAEVGADGGAAAELVYGWVERARNAVSTELSLEMLASHTPSRLPGVELLARVPAHRDTVRYFAGNSRSFRFASRFFSPPEMSKVANVYAYCRVTDDLVDRPGSSSPSALLDEWIGMSRDAYDGRETGIGLLDRVMGEMSSHQVPFDYALDLAEGMRMDLRGDRYPNLAELRTYTYRVASVVGLWLTKLSGVHDARVLERAATLGHAMQLTNILRDVGEDARLGRVYLPGDYMARYGITVEGLIESCAASRPVSREYAALVEDLLQVAERDYAAAFRAIPELPRSFQRPVAVAAHVYRGIHEEIRRSAYDNLRKRAVTSTRNKAVLAMRALWELRSISSAALVQAS